MFERPATRGCALALLVAGVSCARAQEAELPDDDASLAGAGALAGASGGAARAGASNGGANNAGAAAMAGGSGAAGGHAGGSGGGSGTAGKGSTNGGAPSGGSANGGAPSGGAPSGGAPSGGAPSGGVGGVSGSVLFTDDFEDGKTTGWTPTGGTWAIASDGSKVYAQSATGTGSTNLLSAAGSATWTNQIIEAKLKVKAFGGGSTSYLAAVCGRYTGTDYYALALRSDGKLAIRHGNSTLGSAVTAGIVEGTWYTVRFELVGSSLKAYVDGALKDSETDTSISAGSIAVSTVNTTAEFDDIKVTTP